MTIHLAHSSDAETVALPSRQVPSLEVEWVLLAVGAVVVAAGLARRHFGTGETLALLALLVSLRSLTKVFFGRWRSPDRRFEDGETAPVSTRQPRIRTRR